MSQRENISFTDRAIREAQRHAPESLFAQALADYLIRHDRIAADLERGLFWVLPPSGPAQVATFLPLFDPRAPDHFERGAHLSVESDPDIGAI